MELAFWKRSITFGPNAETVIGDLHASLSEAQRTAVCLPWDYADDERGLIRGFIANHWQVTQPSVRSDFFSPTQQALIFRIFNLLLDRRWRAKVTKAMSDDTKGHPWGQNHSIAFLGNPANEPWQFLFTGRHLTLRAQAAGSSAFAFGGPVVYGHAARGFHERPGHRGNVFWPQAVAASRVHALLDARIRAAAEVDSLPDEYDIGFRAQPQGAPVAWFPPRARAEFKNLLATIMQPYRKADRARLLSCLDAQGGAESLYLAFARAPRISAPLWDVWRIEGPAFVWHFQGHPHVHGWVHVASDPEAGPIRARHGAFLFPGHDELL